MLYALQVVHRRGVWDSWLTGKCDLELDSKQQQVAVRGSLRVKAFRFNVTDKQDLQAAVGIDYSMGAGSSSSLVSHSLEAAQRSPRAHVKAPDSCTR